MLAISLGFMNQHFQFQFQFSISGPVLGKGANGVVRAYVDIDSSKLYAVKSGNIG
jgi:hypothetical protein